MNTQKGQEEGGNDNRCCQHDESKEWRVGFPTERKVHLVDLQEDIIYQKLVTCAPTHIGPVVHAQLQFVVVPAEKESAAEVKFQL